MTGQRTLEDENSVRKKIASGQYSSSVVEMVRDEKNLFVRQLKRPDQDTVPASVAQVFNTVIVQADISRFIDALIATGNESIAADLEISYRSVINNLRHFRDLGGRLDQLNEKSLDAIAKFEYESLGRLGDEEFFYKNSKSSIKILHHYANILFIYVMSGYWLYMSEFTKDQTATDKLDFLEAPTKALYEKILQSGYNEQVEVSQSVYAHIFLDKPAQIGLIGTLIEHDSRYGVESDFFRRYSEKCIEKSRVVNGDPYKAERPHPYRSGAEHRLEMAIGIHGVLEKIANIRDVIEELHILGSINESHVVLGEGIISSPISVFRIEHKPDA